jgi:hypothetical protein
LEKPPPAPREAPVPEATGEYQAVLDDMVDAMNPPAEAPASRVASKKPKPAHASKRGAVSDPTITAGVGGSTIG